MIKIVRCSKMDDICWQTVRSTTAIQLQQPVFYRQLKIFYDYIGYDLSLFSVAMKTETTWQISEYSI